MIDSLKIALKFLFFSVADRFAVRKPHRQGGVLLVRLDAIGDYILFRNFIEVLSKSPGFGNQKLTLIGNHRWKTIAEKLDTPFVDEFIWVDVLAFGANPAYRFKTIKRITQTGYSAVINPVYSRELLVQDLLIKHISSPKKIGQKPNTSNLAGWHLSVSNGCYTEVIDASGSAFEFYRNKTFFEKLLGKPIALSKPSISLVEPHISTELPAQYAVLFLGGSNPLRIWPAAKFAEVAKHLNDAHGLEIVVCGGPGDKAHQQEFERNYGGDYTNLVGKTSLVELLFVLARCRLLISNETSAPHMATAMGVPDVLVVSNGNHLGRFVPYPTEITENYHVVFHPEVERIAENWMAENSQKEFVSTLSTADITVQSVLDKVNDLFRNKEHAKS